MTNNKDNIREIFKDITDFRPSKRTLKWEFGYWGETLINWYKEGLPDTENKSLTIKKGSWTGGEALPLGEISFLRDDVFYDNSVTKYFELDPGFTSLPYDYFYFPRFEERIIKEDERYSEGINFIGIRVRNVKGEIGMPMWLEFPIKNRSDWEKIKEERFSLDKISQRYFGNKKEIINKSKNRNSILGIFENKTSFFGSLRFMMGEEKLFMTYYDDPKLIKDILEHLCTLWCGIVEELTSKIDFDIAYFWEDMAGKNGSLISPAIFKEFMTPYYRRIISLLNSKGINKCIVDTDGYVEELIPLFLNAGVNLMYPFERQANNDLLYYRKKYPDLVMIGGFDKNALYKGKKVIDDELEIIKKLIPEGGYIPLCDHLVPPNSSWDNFSYYRKCLNEIIDSNPVRPSKDKYR